MVLTARPIKWVVGWTLPTNIEWWAVPTLQKWVILEFALSFGYTAMILEMGTRQSEAVGLYEKFGYKRCDCWGKYLKSWWSICYRKELSKI